MPVKILLADKSITIQKVVEMLFSGKEYEVTCVSDGEAAMNEASRVVPDVVLADVDLPRLDGYSFASRLRQNSSFAHTPIILMQSRDDTFDAEKARQSGILDHIAKPFESQELIGKVKKALTSAPPRLGEPALTAPKPAESRAPAAPSKSSVPADIFDIIKDAPSVSAKQPDSGGPGFGESVFEVEPVVEIQSPVIPDIVAALPTGRKAVEEIRTGLGLSEKSEQMPAAFSGFESVDLASPSGQETSAPSMAEPREYRPSSRQREVQPEALQGMAEETVAKIAREVLEKVAWEVIPDLAERLIREEITRLKAGS